MGTLVCTVTMDKNAGITVNVENADGKITQTITMDGTTITTKVVHEDDTSTITQNSTSVTIECKMQDEKSTITQNKESITLECVGKNAKSMISQKADTVEVTVDNFKVNAKSVAITASEKDVTLTASAGKLVGKANKNAEISSDTADVKVTGGQNVTISGTSNVTASANQKLSLSGKSKLEASGALVEIKANAQLTAESSGIATLKGSLTNVQGNLVNLG